MDALLLFLGRARMRLFLPVYRLALTWVLFGRCVGPQQGRGLRGGLRGPQQDPTPSGSCSLPVIFSTFCQLLPLSTICVGTTGRLSKATSVRRSSTGRRVKEIVSPNDLHVVSLRATILPMSRSQTLILHRGTASRAARQASNAASAGISRVKVRGWRTFRASGDMP